MSQLPFDAPVDRSVGRATLQLVIAYDGTEFRGFAAQPGERTVEGVLGEALARVLSGAVELSCAGRTDAGVHAWGQVVSIPVDGDVDTTRLRRSLNGMLGPEVVVRDAQVVAPDFDARHSARWRSYRYTIVNRPSPDPFLARYAWWVPEPLDLTLLRLGSDPFLGEHDFSTFCRKGPAGSHAVRRVLSSEWCDAGDGILRYDISTCRDARRRGPRQDPPGGPAANPPRARPCCGWSRRTAARAVLVGRRLLSSNE